MGAPSPNLVADLRARRLARQLIELVERLDAETRGVATWGEDEHLVLHHERELLITRLERAARRLAPSAEFRWAIEAACSAHRTASVATPGSDAAQFACVEFAAALMAMRETMRRSSRPPPPIGP